MEELPKKEQIIEVSSPYSFDTNAKILSKGGLIVKNCWPNGPSQEEIDEIISKIEAAVEMLRIKGIQPL